MNETQRNKIASLRTKYAGTDNGSLGYIDEIEREFTRMIEESKMAQNPIFQAIVKDAEKKMNDINALLMNDESLTDRQRDKLFAQKEIWIFIFRRFRLETENRAIELLEKTIEDKLQQ